MEPKQRGAKSGAGTGASRAVRLLRGTRSMHGAAALVLLVLVVVSAVTGLVLSWKKDVDALQPPTREGTTADLRSWLPIHLLAATASRALADHLESDEDEPSTARRDPLAPDPFTPERLDVRPDDGIVKVLFPGAWEVQVDGATAAVLSVARRHSDWIETIHDGSIISDAFKLVSMNALGLGLLALAVSGFWMWYGPKRLRKRRTMDRKQERKTGQKTDRDRRTA